ncbi:MAG: hypothetical protein K2X38_21340 [Gemmataceae bacterium]|nr:hypothetical protein [Gemmataceae bacterium]
METIQLQCGNCKNMMAISTEHLGAQVQCPHCQAVLQTPPPPSAPAPTPPPPREPAIPTFRRPERDSIFSEPEPVDDLFGAGDPPPRVELPKPAAIAASMSDAFAAARDGHADHDESLPGGSMPAPRREAPKSAFTSYLLIGLISYSICTTGMVAYLLSNWPSINAFDWLADPAPGKGGARQSKTRQSPDAPLPAKNIVAINDSITIGEVSVTPAKVTMSPEGNLILTLRIKNVSTETRFTPISDSFLKASETRDKPYTYLEGNSGGNLVGGYLEVKRIKGGDDEGNLGPSDEAFFRVTTTDRPDDRLMAKKIADRTEPVVWRVQVRRGFVNFRGRPVSATAVIGVRFNPTTIEKEA